MSTDSTPQNQNEFLISLLQHHYIQLRQQLLTTRIFQSSDNLSMYTCELYYKGELWLSWSSKTPTDLTETFNLDVFEVGYYG